MLMHFMSKVNHVCVSPQAGLLQICNKVSSNLSILPASRTWITTRSFSSLRQGHYRLLKPNHNSPYFIGSSLRDAAKKISTKINASKKAVNGIVIKRLRNAQCRKFSYKSSTLLSVGVTGVILGSSITQTLWDNRYTFFMKALCEAKPSHRNRLSHNDDKDYEESKKTDPKFQWRLLFHLLWEDIFYLLAAVVAAFGAALVNIQIPLMLGELTNIVTKFASDATSDVADFLSEIKFPALKLLSVYALQGLMTFSYISLLALVGENMAGRLRRQLFHSLLEQDIEFFDTHRTGELVDRLTSDVQEFKSSFKLTISQGLRATTQTIGCAISLFVISPKLTVVMLGIIPVIVIGGASLGAILRSFSRDAQEQISKSTSVAEEALGNVRTVRAFAMETKEFELYKNEVDKASLLNIKLGIGIGLFQGGANMFLNGIVLGSLFAGGWLISKHELKAGDLISFLVATQMIERSMAQMSLLLGHIVRGLSAGARVFEYINGQPTIPLKGGKRISYQSLFGDLEFTNVSFHYPTREQNVLRDFNLKIHGGHLVALVGLSGGGKSTVAALLERFYDVTAGSITLDGINLKELDPSWLRGRVIGFIEQEPVLFATTVMENIRYGRPDATDEEVYEAAHQANADQFIQNFPNGYQTVLGERGVTVSGGQKQRIAIARALIKSPSILILDEATSALDAESERLVQDALDKVVKGRTTLVIAHRLSTIRDADMIAVVSRGKIMELGTHSELKAKRGLYWDLIKMQELEEDIEGK